jgi:hypothetical protein
MSSASTEARTFNYRASLLVHRYLATCQLIRLSSFASLSRSGVPGNLKGFCDSCSQIKMGSLPPFYPARPHPGTLPVLSRRRRFAAVIAETGHFCRCNVVCLAGYCVIAATAAASSIPFGICAAGKRGSVRKLHAREAFYSP